MARKHSSTMIAGAIRRSGLTLGPKAQTFLVDPSFAGFTLQDAIDKCVAGNGDIIVMQPGGHTVTQTVTFNKTGIHVIGIDYGINPRAKGEIFALLANASFTNGPVATITKRCYIEGMGFASRDNGANFFAGAACLIGGLGTASPFGAHLKNCRFPKWGLDNRIGLSIEGSSDVLIEDCGFEGVGADFDSGIYVQGAVQNLTIVGCHFRQCTYAVTLGAFAGGGPHMILGPDNVCEDAKLLDSQGNTAPSHVIGNYLETATNSASYDASTATLNGQGIQFSGNHYKE